MEDERAEKLEELMREGLLPGPAEPIWTPAPQPVWAPAIVPASGPTQSLEWQPAKPLNYTWGGADNKATEKKDKP